MALTSEQVSPPAPSPSAAPRSRAVAHALSAGGAGILLCLGIPAVGILAFAGVPGLVLALVVMLAGSGLAFGLTGSGFLGRRGGWLAFTALPWTVTEIAFWLLGMSIGELWIFMLTMGAAGSIVGAGCALVAWRGAPRLIGAGMLLLVVGVAVTWMVSIATVQQQGSTGYRGDLTAFTTTVPGYTAGVSTASADRTTVTYRSVAHVFLLGAEPFDTDACGADLIAPGASAETELSCSASAERWYRTSATLHEVAVVRDGWVVRASAAQTVPLGDLENAVALAIPDGAEWVSDAPG